MNEVRRIDVIKALELQSEHNANLVDIRDIQAFSSGHAVNAFHLTNHTLAEVINSMEFETPLLVMCYHGISSLNVAQYLLSQGFEQVYSIDGGFEAWSQANLPTEISL